MKRLALITSLIAMLVGLIVWNPFEPSSNIQNNSPEQISVGDPSVPANLKAWKEVEDFDQPLAVLETVFWDPRDTISLRALIRESGMIADKKVLEIGTGSGLLSLCCIKAGASEVVATDVNPAAIECANYNSIRLELSERLDARLVNLKNTTAFAVIGQDEKFDFIISNPPWVNKKPNSIDEYALYDENFALLISLFDGLETHLNPGGKLFLAYGCVDAIKTIQRLSDERNFELTLRDPRDLDKLPEEFLPGFLVEIKTPESKRP